MKKFLILILIFILKINFINCIDSFFKTTTTIPEFNINSNWNTSKIPGPGDDAYINTVLPLKRDLIVYSLINPIDVHFIIVGNSSDPLGNTTFVAQQTNITAVGYYNDVGSTFFANGYCYTNISTIFNLGEFYLYSVSFENLKLYSLLKGRVILYQSVGITTYINLEENGIVALFNSTLYVLNNIQNSPLSIQSGSKIAVNTTSQLISTIDYVIDGNDTGIIGSNAEIEIFNYNSNNENDNYFINNNGSLKFEKTLFYIEKTIAFFGDSSFYSSESNSIFKNVVFFSDHVWVTSYKSNFTFFEPLVFKGNSTLVSTSGSIISLYNLVQLSDISAMIFNESKIIIAKDPNSQYTDDLFMYMTDDSALMVNSSNILFQDASVVTQGTSKILFKDSQVYIRNHILLNDTSQLYHSNTNSLISGHIFLQDKSTFMALHHSNISIQGNVTFYDSSLFYLNESNVYIEGSLHDLTEREKQNGLTYSNIYINGIYNNRGNFSLYYSTLDCNNQFFTYGGSDIYESTIKVTNGNFYNFGHIRAVKSNFQIIQGSMFFFENSEIESINSIIIILNGILHLEKNTNIFLLNTVLYNQLGSLETGGDITIDVGSTLKNNGTITLISNILVKQNSTYNGDEKVINQGTFEIKNNNTTPNDSSSYSSNISIPFHNTDNGLIDISKIVKFISLNQFNNSNLKLSTSNASLIIENNFTTNQNNSIILTIDDNNTSLISIENEFQNNNSTLIIRVDINRKQEINSTVLQWSNQSGTGFSNIIFKSYNPNTGEETDINDSCHQTINSANNLKVLISNNCSNINKKLSKGAIAGIVLGIVGASVIVGLLIYYKKPLYYNFFYKIRPSSIKLAIKK